MTQLSGITRWLALAWVVVACCRTAYPETYRVTAYCPCKRCTARGTGITASGKPVTANGGRFCAADRSIPFGTMMAIPGYGTVPVLDRGGAIKGKRLDVFFPTHKAALAWGVKYLDVQENPK